MDAMSNSSRSQWKVDPTLANRRSAAIPHALSLGRGSAASLVASDRAGEDCAAKLLAYRRAGAQRVFLPPLADERAQLEVFRDLACALARP
jgi:hypothetical protein